MRLPAPGQAEVWQGQFTPCAVAGRGPDSDARPHLHALAQGTHVWSWSPFPPHELGSFAPPDRTLHPNAPPLMPLRAGLELARAWLAVCAGLFLRDDTTEADGALFAACGRSGPEPLVPWAEVMADGRWMRTGLSTEDGRVVLDLHLTAPALRTFVRDLESALEVYDRVAAGEIWEPSSHGSNWVVPDEPASNTGEDR